MHPPWKSVPSWTKRPVSEKETGATQGFPSRDSFRPGLPGPLELPEAMVEVIFINGKAHTPANAVIHPGDRVALAPPGVPGPYRVLLGFKNLG